MIEKKLFSLKGKERLDFIEDLPFDITEDICFNHKSCKNCPLAVIFNSKAYCSDMVAFYRVDGLLKIGGKFTELGEVSSETES